MLPRNLAVLLLALLVGRFNPAGAQERFGGLAGVVADPGEAPVPGATITATNAQTSARRTVVSGGDGTFRIPDLEPGRYSIVVELQGFQKAQVEDVLILLGRTHDFSAALKVGAITDVVSVTAEAGKQIDLRNTTVSHNVTAEEIDRLPKSRTFQSLALTAPSVNSGELEGGLQVNGASGAENVFTIDGVVTNSLINGRSRQDTVFEYVQEVQVKTTGIAAEYGGALGGVISVVTKSGGNTLRGEGHYYFLGSSMSAAGPKRLNLDPRNERTIRTILDHKQPDSQNEIGGSVGGSIIRNRLFFFGSYSPRLRRQTNEYLFSDGVEPGEIKRKQTLTQLFGKVTYGNNRLTASGSLLMTPTRSTGTLPLYQGSGANYISSSLASNAIKASQGFSQDQTNASGNVGITLSNAALLTVRGGYFYDNYKDTGIPNQISHTYQATTAGVPGIPANLQGPVGTQDVPRIRLNEFDTTKRAFLNADYSHNFVLGGNHLLKGGFGVQHTINDVNQMYNGGAYVYVWWGQNFVFQGDRGSGTYGYYEVDNVGTQGKAGANIVSLYVQDQWSVGNRLTLDLGVRTENEKIPSFRPEILETAISFGFQDKIAPRLGASYDLRGDGRTKLYGSWGRYFDWTKYELARGSYGGDVWQIYYRSLDTLDITSLNLTNKPGRDLWVVPGGFRDRRVPNFSSTDPGIKPMYQDSVSIGLEHDLGGSMVFGTHYVHNILRRTIEDLGAVDASGNEAYVIGNPGEGLAKIQFPYTATPLGQPVPKPKRQYDALEFTLNRRYSNNYFWSASYVLSRLYGNYSGVGSSDEITSPSTGFLSTTAQQASGSAARPGGNAVRAWDIDELLWDSHGNVDPQGRLATDRPHVVKLYGGYTFPFGTTLGLNFSGGSGTPLSTYVATTNGTSVFVNGRGDMGRTPMLVRTDLLASHEVKLSGTKRVRAEFNVLNVFNRQVARWRWPWLNRGSPDVRPSSAIDLSTINLLKGYDYNALIRDSPDGRAGNAYDPRYGMDDLFDTGAQGYFSIKLLF